MEQEEIEQLAKPKWYSCVPVKVEKVILEVTGKDTKQVQRIRLVTDLGDITHKPRQIVDEKTTSGAFEVQSSRVDLLDIDEFIVNNPMLKKLAEDCKKKPQEVTLTYAEIGRLDEETGEPIYYKYMQRNQFESIYYGGFHGKDKSNIETQKERQKKYEEREL